MASPIKTGYDVIVAGGGPAGTVAAIAAARNGARTLLLEQLGFLGGNPVAGLILHGFHNQRGERVIDGIPYELVERMRSEDAAIRRVEIEEHRTLAAAISVDVEAMKYVSAEMVLEAGAEILFHTAIVDTLMEGSATRGVVIHNKSGLQSVLAKVVVDASGDGDVAYKAGARFEIGRASDGLTQPMTLLFTVGGVDLETVVERNRLGHGRSVDAVPGERPGQINWFAATLEPWAEEAEREGLFPHVSDKRSLRFWGNSFRSGEANLNATFINTLDGTNATDLTRAEIECRRQAIQLVKFLKAHVPGFEDAYIIRTGARVGVRETRRIVGDYTLSYQDFLDEARFPDAVVRAGFFADIHNPEPKGGLHVPAQGDMSVGHGDFDIPFRAMLPAGIHDLVVAGRCISASPEAFASARVAGTVMGMGQAAGTAAALAVASGVRVRDLDISTLQARLVEQGADLGGRQVPAGA